MGMSNTSSERNSGSKWEEEGDYFVYLPKKLAKTRKKLIFKFFKP